MAAKTRKTATATATAPEPAKEFDFSSVEVTDVAEMPKGTRKRDGKPNPFLAQMTASKENDWAPKQITIPEDAVKSAKGFIRRAADDLGCGARIVERNNEDGTVTVFFSAKQRRKYTPRQRTETTE